MLFTGDHVMQGSTVVINPPDGDMSAYLRSLARLLDEDLAILAPGHGFLIGAPHKEIRRLIAHRLGREKKVLSKLRTLGKASLEELVPMVYDDVPARLHGAAARSLTAHLRKLAAEGRIHEMKDEERTLELVTDLDRGAIEARLLAVRKAAQSSNLAELAAMFHDVEGMPRTQMATRVANALRWLADKPQHQRIAADLELVELNLPNLK